MNFTALINEAAERNLIVDITFRKGEYIVVFQEQAPSFAVKSWVTGPTFGPTASAAVRELARPYKGPLTLELAK